MDVAREIAEAVLYEGYILWPYRRSAMKNRQRWTFGGVYPRAYSEARGEDDPWLMQTQCLVLGDDPTIEVRVRFLHVVERRVGRKNPDGTVELVDELRVGGERYLSWDEAAEREVVIGGFHVSEPGSSARAAIDVPGGSAEEELVDPDGEVAGTIARSWRALRGTVEVEAERLKGGVFKVTVRITNTADWGGEDRESVLRRTFVSTHTALDVQSGEFVSMTDPPEELREAARGCENLKTWPVLVGEEGARNMLLSSPIILSDYPRVAPESPGDMFDGGEIDQLLILNILTLTDEEKEEMRATDPRAREILTRCESLSPEELMKLHGAIRDFKMVRE